MFSSVNLPFVLYCLPSRVNSFSYKALHAFSELFFFKQISVDLILIEVLMLADHDVPLEVSGETC